MLEFHYYCKITIEHVGNRNRKYKNKDIEEYSFSRTICRTRVERKENY